MKSPTSIFMQNAQPHPKVASIINRALGIQESARLGIMEEGKKVLKEEGEPAQSGSSAIDSNSLGDYKVYGRGWVRPAKRPQAGDQLPEEKEKTEADPDAELYKEQDEGKEWCWSNEDFIEKVADKVAEILVNLADDSDDADDAVDSTEFDDDLFYDPDDDEEIDDTPYEMNGLDEEIEIDDPRLDEEEEEPTLEEQAEYQKFEMENFSSFTLMQEMNDEFNIQLDKELCAVIEEAVFKKPLNKGELIRRKLVAGRRMKRMASKMKARRKVKFFRTDMKTVKSRVHKAAIKFLKNKFAKSKGGKYDDLSLSAKVDVDAMVKRRANLIPNIERKLFSKYRAKMAQRRKNKSLKK